MTSDEIARTVHESASLCGGSASFRVGQVARTGINFPGGTLLKHLQSREDWNEKSLGAKGFTLIELLVVIVILGILAAVVVFAVSGITDKGTKSACKTEARTVKTAVEAYYAQEGSYPTSIGQLTANNAFLENTPENITVTFGSPPTYAWNSAGGSKCTNASAGGAP
jgi:prepilin-type N-terminal cleavage/methylation domain-containing protein